MPYNSMVQFHGAERESLGLSRLRQHAAEPWACCRALGLYGYRVQDVWV